MKAAPKRRRRLNSLGRVTIAGLALLWLSITLFAVGGMKGNDVEAVQSTESHKKDTERTEEAKFPVPPPDFEQLKDETDALPPVKVEKEPVAEVPLKTNKTVYLTFDDGPSNASADILRVLDQYGAKGTFFMLEPNMRKHSDAVKQMAHEGHSVGVHGVSHNAKKIYQSPNSFVGEMNQAISCVKELTGINTKLVRAPYGSKPYITPPFEAAVEHENYLLWDWTIDSLDWKLKNGEYVAKVESDMKKVEAQGKPLVVLLHDKPSTFEHLESLLSYLKKMGFDMLPLDESMSPIQF